MDLPNFRHRMRSNNENAEQDDSLITNEADFDQVIPSFTGLCTSQDMAMDYLVGKYWITRVVLLRYIAFIYFVAFLVALQQNSPLLGANGLLPATNYLNRVEKHVGHKLYNKLSAVPSLLWFSDESNVDLALFYIAFGGLVISTFVIIKGAANWFIMAALWILYHSLVNVGQTWYSFGWESQLLESGFLAIFLCPVWNISSFDPYSPPSTVTIFMFRWLIFRIMLGAGLIKIRGDKCWLDLTCMNYHYETQPVPNPISYYLHQSPNVMHKLEVLSNHFVELVASFFVLVPGVIGYIGGIIQIAFQVVLIISGNLSFLNWLTILPSLACFDDRFYVYTSSYLPSFISRYVLSFILKSRQVLELPVGCYIRRIFNITFGLFIAYLSIPVIQNLLSSNQAMNTSFDSLRIVNTYGAFGSITKTRTEVIVQGTNSSDPYSKHAVWREYEFKCKPGAVSRRPCLISPYHYRLDWLMWFAAFQNYRHNPWLVHLTIKLLANDPGTTSLIERNPFYESNPPVFIRAEHYKYSYTRIGSKAAARGNWWHRKYLGNYMPPISLDTASGLMKQFHWKDPRL